MLAAWLLTTTGCRSASACQVVCVQEICTTIAACVKVSIIDNANLDISKRQLIHLFSERLHVLEVGF